MSRQAVVDSSVSDLIRSALLAAASPDGGWGAFANRPSNAEATALASLALGGDPAAARARRWLLENGGAAAGWGYTPADPPASWTTALAILALRHEPDPAGRVRSAVDWLIRDETGRVPWRVRLQSWLAPEEQVIELDYGVRGWPWVTGSFGWVEPTSWAVLALRALGGQRAGRGAGARLDDAAAMLHDRACVGGGWNYGNRRVMDVDLEPYPDTTALALLALEPRGDGRSIVEQGFAALDRMIDENASGLACALAALAQRAHGRDPARARASLEARFALAGFLGETRVLALALLALDAGGLDRLGVAP